MINDNTRIRLVLFHSDLLPVSPMDERSQSLGSTTNNRNKIIEAIEFWLHDYFNCYLRVYEGFEEYLRFVGWGEAPDCGKWGC